MTTISAFYLSVFLFFCLVTNNLHAILVELHRLHDRQGKKVDLLSDLHTEKPETAETDRTQLEALTAHLARHDSAEKPVEVLVEVPHDIWSRRPKVTRSIIQFLAERALQSTFGKNIEMRSIAWAALYTLQKETPPCAVHDDYRINTPDQRSRAIKDITFQDLEEEFNEQLSFLHSAKKVYAQDVEALFDEHLRHIQEEFEQLKRDCGTYHIAPEDHLLQKATTFFDADREDIRQLFYTRIRRVSQPLFDLYALNHVLSTHESKKVILIAGAEHILEVRSMLIESGFRQFFSKGDFLTRPSEYLQESDFAQLNNEAPKVCSIL